VLRSDAKKAVSVSCSLLIVRSDAMYDLIVQYLYVPWEPGKGTLSSVPLMDP